MYKLQENGIETNLSHDSCTSETWLAMCTPLYATLLAFLLLLSIFYFW